MKSYIQLKLFASLRSLISDKKNIQIKAGTTVKDLIVSVGIQPSQVKLIFINGRAKQINSQLYNGDRVGLFPPIGGG